MGENIPGIQYCGSGSVDPDWDNNSRIQIRKEKYRSGSRIFCFQSSYADLKYSLYSIDIKDKKDIHSLKKINMIVKMYLWLEGAKF